MPPQLPKYTILKAWEKTAECIERSVESQLSKQKNQIYSGPKGVTLAQVSIWINYLENVINRQYFSLLSNLQRLYVWGKEQIHNTFALDDIQFWHGQRINEFYLGGIALVIERTVSGLEDTRYYDLIDGQQRFTTLWLISVVLKEHLVTYTTGYKAGKRQRISLWFISLTNFWKKYVEDLPASLPEAMQLEDALQEIRAYFDNYYDKKETLDKKTACEFILTKISTNSHCVLKHDLNKLFEVINNRGVQLQHHEILKA